MMFPRALAILALLILGLAPAQAHVSNFGDTKTLLVGPYTVLLEASPSPVFTNNLVQLSVQVLGEDGMPRQVPANLTLVHPNGTTKDLRLQRNPQAAGHYANTFLSTSGNHTLRVGITDANGTMSGETWLDVYPDLPVRVSPANEAQDITAGEEAVFAVRVADAGSLQPARLDDLAGRIELWNNDHTRMLSEANVTFTQVQPGIWSVKHRFTEVGMYHVRFASRSANFTYEDVPLLHTYATEPLSPATPTTSQQTPLGGVVLVGFALLSASLLLKQTRKR